MPTQSDPRGAAALRRSRQLLVFAGALALGLAVAAGLLARELRRERAKPAGDSAAESAAAATQFAATTRDQWDSHPDADIGRVLQPKLEGAEGPRSNRFGLSEAEFEIPKPAGTVRVVLLGDSFVHGYGVERDQRLGVHLQRWLAENARKSGANVEVLHVGLPSWNIRAESAYLRRSLSLLGPDLVVHVLICNDLDDTASVRGFGVMANFTSQHRTRANALTDSELPLRIGGKKPGLLPYGLDHESRTRYADARADLERLEAAVRAAGGEYVVLLNWLSSSSAANDQLLAGRAPRSVLYLSDGFANDARHRNSAEDPHWSPEGHRKVASLLYGAICERALLPAVDPAPLEEHLALLRELHAEGERGTADPQGFYARHLANLSSVLRLPIDDATPLEQVHAGLDQHGNLAPYFAAMLATKGGRTLRVSGKSLERRELDGARVEVQVDEVTLGSITLSADQTPRADFDLPSELQARPAVTVRLVASDYAYLKDLRRCGVFVLRELAIEP
jgi:hypothetical protein